MRFLKQAFTLAEIMIVLTVVGVLTAILLPAAFHATPDENIMKFKKANSTLGTIILELVNSDKYYSNGDLGIRADGTLIDRYHEGDYTYFCETLAEILNVKSKNCSEAEMSAGGSVHTYWNDNTMATAKDSLDSYCKENASTVGEEIKTPEGIVYYQGDPSRTFGSPTGGVSCNWDACPKRAYGGTYVDENGFDECYKIFCIDVDGINKGEDPFGYGIRVDGKILPGKRADEWIKKSIQKGE